MPAADINPAKVLVIVNSANAQSAADADDYQAKRGAGAIRLGFDFTGSAGNTVIDFATLAALQCNASPASAYNGQPYFTAVLNALRDLACEGVILSTFTPASYWTGQTFSGFQIRYPLAAVTAAALKYAGQVTAPNPDWSSLPSRATAWFAGNDVNPWTRALPDPPIHADWLNQMRSAVASPAPFFLPNGRLGMPDFNSTTIAERALIAGGKSIYQNAVDNARAVANENALAKTHVISTTEFYNVNAAGQTIETGSTKNGLAGNICTDYGIPRINIASSGGDIVANDFWNTTLPQKVRYFAFIMSGTRFGSQWPPVVNPAYSVNLDPMPGAWGGYAQSFSGGHAGEHMARGCSAFIATAGEPGTSISHPTGAFWTALRSGCSLMLASIFSASLTDSAAWPCAYPQAQTVYGDPLYRPYAALGAPAIAHAGSLLTVNGAALRLQ